MDQDRMDQDQVKQDRVTEAERRFLARRLAGVRGG
jgi:hypothetical protein